MQSSNLVNENKTDKSIIDMIHTNSDNRYLDFDINSSFLYELISGMPKNLSKFEKTVYIYLKLCSILTYDEEFYLFDQNKEVKAKHSDIKKLSTITSTNNQVVCYEFNFLFAKMLDMLDCDFKIDTQILNDAFFGNGHTNLTYICDDYIIGADGVKSILNCDLQLVKRGLVPEGILCKNQSEDKKRKFEQTLVEMLSLIAFNDNVKSFNDILSEYKKIETSNMNISLNKRLEMLFTLLSKQNLCGIDAIGYINVLKKKLFFDLKNNIDMTIAIEYNENGATPVIIFTINNDTINDFDSNLYVCFNVPNKLRNFNRFELQKMFDDKIFGIRNKGVLGIVGDSLNDIRKR